MFHHHHTSLTLRLALGLACAAATGCASTGATTEASLSNAGAFEQSKCGGVTDDAAVSEILSGRSIESVSPLYVTAGDERSVTVLQGVVLMVRPTPGETAEWLGRALECHSAKIAARQGAAIAAGNDPFAPSGSMPSIAVRSAGDGFRIEITSQVTDEARDILSRAQALRGAPTSPVALQRAQ